jgi:hypothetical protein
MLPPQSHCKHLWHTQTLISPAELLELLLLLNLIPLNNWLMFSTREAELTLSSSALTDEHPGVQLHPPQRPVQTCINPSRHHFPDK